MAVLVSSALIVLLFSRISALTADVHTSAAKCTLEIAKNYFTTDAPNINLFLINSSRDDELLSLVYQSPMHSKTVTDFTSWKVNFNDSKRRFAIVVAESMDEIIFYKHQIAKLNLWNPRARYIFIIRDSSIKNLDQTVNILWNNYIINGLVMLPSRNNQTVQEIYSWFPYENGQCGESFKARIVDVCEHGRLMENVDLFLSKVPDVMNNCLLRARVVIWPPIVMPPDDGKVDTPLNITRGVEILLFEIAAQHLNIKPLLTSSTTQGNWGIVTTDGNATGNIRSLMLREIDMCFGSYGAMIERRMYCDYTTTMYSESMTWCVPRAQLASKWRNLIDIFKYRTWLSVLATYLLVTGIIWYFCNLQPKDVTSYVMFHDSLKFLFSIYLTVSCSEIPKKSSGRIVFVMWIFFSMHLVAAYQAKLITVLMNPTYDTQINTMDEIITGGLQWGLVPSSKRYFANTDDWRVRLFLRNGQPCPDVDACFDRIAYKRDFSILMLSNYARYQSLNYLDKNFQSKIYCFPKTYLTFPTEMYLIKGFPFRERLNAVIRRIQQAGFIPKWHRDYVYREFIRQLKLFNRKHPHKRVAKLTTEHLQGAFLTVLLGLLAALLAFIGEQLVYKIQRKKQINNRPLEKRFDGFLN